MLADIKQYFASLLRRKKESPPEARSEGTSPHYVRRLHPRHGPLRGAIKFLVPELGSVDVVNLAVGGALIEAIGAELEPFLSPGGELQGELLILHERIPCVLLPVNYYDAATGCRFIHSDQSLILWLRRHLDLFRIGHNMKLVGVDPATYAAEGFSLVATKTQVEISGKSPHFDVSLGLGDREEVLQSAHGPDELVMALFVLLGFQESQGTGPLVATIAAAISRTTAAFESLEPPFQEVS